MVKAIVPSTPPDMQLTRIAANSARVSTTDQAAY
jgi:hypothetical protein